MRHAAMLTAALLLAATTACSPDEGKPTVSKATDTPSASSTPSPTPTPSPSEETYRVGDTANISASGKKWSAAALTYKGTGIAGEPILQPGQKWAAVEVKVCNKGAETFPVGPFAWSLAYEDGARVEATHVSGGNFPQPLYPMDAKVRSGDCVRGHILFEAPKDGRPERVLYSPDDLDEPVEWQVGE